MITLVKLNEHSKVVSNNRLILLRRRGLEGRYLNLSGLVSGLLLHRRPRSSREYFHKLALRSSADNPEPVRPSTPSTSPLASSPSAIKPHISINTPSSVTA